ncbi:Uncharacterised protein [Mycobacterium tuberculosis]|nr:Uncharacterised protein [Mycobacterium tuberculosis]
MAASVANNRPHSAAVPASSSGSPMHRSRLRAEIRVRRSAAGSYRSIQESIAFSSLGADSGPHAVACLARAASSRLSASGSRTR